ncbi:hypothetical protein NMG60_11032622, partial [Bertholletia excelsa]
MGEDQMQLQDNEQTITPLSPCASPQSPSRKRLLADSKPKQGSAAMSSDSIVSSDLSSDRLRKKTRDLPNLSDCRCCGIRVNSSNPKEKLQTLDSFWRIVLLCKKCLKRVDLAEFYKCRDCDRLVHRACVERYRCFAPWSYCSELGFSVCVDCWMPKLMINSYKARNRRNKKNASKQCVEADARVSGSSAKPKSLEDVVNDAKNAVEKKISVATKAKKNALRKAVVARRAMELANGALEMIAKKDENGTKNELLSVISASDATAMVDDAELAFRLHRVMNSSPRISKNSSLVNSSAVTARRLCNDNGNLSGLVYSRRCKKGKDSWERDGGIKGNCYPGVYNSLISESQSCHKQDELGHESFQDDTVKESKLVRNKIADSLGDEKCNGELDQYVLKYRRRPVGFKPIFSSGTKILCAESDSAAVGPHCLEECRSFSVAFQRCAIPLQTSACTS